MLGTERIQREDAAAKEDRIFRVAVVEADQNRGGIVGNRAGRGDRHTAPFAAERRRYQLDVPGISAHGIAIKGGIHLLPAHQNSVLHVLSVLSSPANMEVWSYLFYNAVPENRPKLLLFL